HIETALAELDRVGLIRLYSVSDVRYAWFPSWHDHQVINRPTPSRLPPCPPDGEITETSVSPHSGSDRKGKEKIGKETDRKGEESEERETFTAGSPIVQKPTYNGRGPRTPLAPGTYQEILEDLKARFPDRRDDELKFEALR